jgi:hypothetical protein
MDVIADLADRQAVQGFLTGLCVEQHGPVELNWVKQVGEVADGVREIHQLILEHPILNIVGTPEAEDEVG